MPGVAVFGITGRMGQSLVRALAGSPLHLSGALASPSSRRLGLDAAEEGAPSGVRVTADPEAALRDAAVALDFSSPLGLGAHAGACAARGVPLLVGTTGFDSATRAMLESAALVVPVLIAPNTSVGVGVLRQLAALAAAALGAGFDVEISEAHHRLKRDAPSGTALALAEAVAAGARQRTRRGGGVRPARPVRAAQAREHRIFVDPRGRHRRRAHRDLRLGWRAASSSPTAPRTGWCSRGARSGRRNG